MKGQRFNTDDFFQLTCDNDTSRNNNITQSVDDDDKENGVQLNPNGVLATKNKQVGSY